MINPGHKVLTAWYELLNGNLSVEVYRTDVPVSERGNYVRLRLESSTQSRTNVSDIYHPVIITEVVTRYDAMINDKEVFDIDNEIAALFSTHPSKHNLPQQDDISIVVAVRQTGTLIQEDTDGIRWNRLITRNVHRIIEMETAAAAPDGVFEDEFSNEFA